ncbi:MAG: MaoC family dehydratase [Alphaproteobacteria bacterium]|nr:MaoC family dehydratase [Alphaproteobacteria bacterium]
MFFEDFQVGDSFTTPGKTITEAEILEFAFIYDPQPLHTNKVAAEKSDFAGLIASGFHTLSLSFSLFFRLRLLDEANLASPGMDEVRWLAPVRPEDTLHVVAEVTEVRPSKSQPDKGIIFMNHFTYNQRNEKVLSVHCMHRLRCRS